MIVSTRRRLLRGLVVGMLIVGCAGVATAQEKDPMIGTWKFNAAKSNWSPGPAPKEMTVTIEPAGPGRKVEVVGVAQDGSAIKWGFTGNFDSKDIKITGSNPEADVVMLKRLSPTTTRSTYKKGGNRTLVNGVSVSADGKTLTVASTGVNAKGQTVKNTSVYDKQ